MRRPVSAAAIVTLLFVGLDPMVEPVKTIEIDNEQARVASWRLHVLVEAGYPIGLAERLAHSEIDLHRAVELILRGCRHETAAEILL
jgi:hypothetical protein